MTSSERRLFEETASQTERTYLEEELIWGKDYHNAKTNTPRRPMRSKSSPINVGFQICRALQSQKKKVCQDSIKKTPSPTTLLQTRHSTKISSITSTQVKKCKCKSKSKSKSSSVLSDNKNTKKASNCAIKQHNLTQKKSLHIHLMEQENKLKSKFVSTPTLDKCLKKKSSCATKIPKTTKSKNLDNKNKSATKTLASSSLNNFTNNPFRASSLLQRNLLSQNEYMTFLSQPSSKNLCRQPKKCASKKCAIDPCPPRIIQLATPRKQLVLANWKNHEQVLQPEAIIRFHNILQGSGNNTLELREARSYFRRLDEKRRKELFKKRRKKKRKIRSQCEAAWLNNQIKATADAMIEHLQYEDLVLMNYGQMLMSDMILKKLTEKGVVALKNRNTANTYEKSVIEICDKIACWAEKLSKFVDIKPLDSKELLEEPSAESLLEDYETDSDLEGEESMYDYAEENEEVFEDRLAMILDIFSNEIEESLYDADVDVDVEVAMQGKSESDDEARDGPPMEAIVEEDF